MFKIRYTTDLNERQIQNKWRHLKLLLDDLKIACNLVVNKCRKSRKYYSSKLNLKSITITYCILSIYSFALYAANYTIPYLPHSLMAGDYNGDGNNDLVIGHQTYGTGDSYTQSQLSVLQNIGDGQFTVATTISFPGASTLVSFCQIDNVEADDIASLFFQGNDVYVRVFYNGDFNQAFDYYIASDAMIGAEFAADIGDVNGDDLPDLVFTAGESPQWGWMRNIGNHQFSNPVWYASPISPFGFFEIAGADFNLDGFYDVAVLGHNAYVYYSNGVDFTQQLIAGPIYNSTFIVSDMDNDGDYDISISNWDGGNTNHFRFYENQANATYVCHEQILLNTGFSHAISGDVNNDGYPDILNVSIGSNFWVYLNLGNWTLEPYPVAIDYCGENHQYACMSDFDGNGTLDICIIRDTAQQDNLTILYNDGEGNFQSVPDVHNNDELTTWAPTVIRCYPNPGKSTINFDLLNFELESTIYIYNIRGQFVKSIIINGNRADWNLKDNDGRIVPNGVYLARIDTKSKQSVIKFIIANNGG